jgi:uncharacterized protein YeaO (DUF488 family)
MAFLLSRYGSNYPELFGTQTRKSHRQRRRFHVQGLASVRPIPTWKDMAASNIALKRAYEAPAAEDGMRILIDRLWPRGVKKAEAAIDRWPKELAPSAELRRWFGHKPERWPEFRRRYRAELERHPDLVEELRASAGRQRVTLVYGAKDEARNDAVVLRELLAEPGPPRSR